MRLPHFEYFEPETLKSAVNLILKNKESKFLAGGTDLMPKFKKGVIRPEVLINIKEITGINSIKEEKNYLKIGALVTLGEIEDSPLINQVFPSIVEAAHSVATQQLRNTATLGGNLCQDTRCLYFDNSYLFGQSIWEKCFKRGGNVCHLVKKGKKCLAVYSGDVAPVLLALNAKVQVVGSSGKRLISLSEIYSGKGDNAFTLLPEELIAEIHVPKPKPSSYGTYVKFRERGSIDFPIVGIAAYLTINKDTIKDANIWLTSVGSAPVEAVEAESVLKGANISTDLIEKSANQAYQQIAPVPNHGYSAWYIKEMVKVFVKRALIKVMENARGGQS